MIGWMNNWQYAGSVPCSPWRSAMTLPRELSLKEYDGKPLLCSKVVPELDAIAEGWKDAGAQWDIPDAYQLQINLKLDQNASFTLFNEQGEKLEMGVYAQDRVLYVKRNAGTGKTSFNGSFSVPSMQGPLCVVGDTVTLDIYVDQSSVEVFTAEGTLSLTNLVFPSSIYNSLKTAGSVQSVKIRRLKSIWK